MKNLKFICTNHPDINKLINNVPDKFDDGCYNLHNYAGGIYLDGKVEYANGYDCVELLHADDIKYFRHTDSSGTTVEIPDFTTGIYDCEVYGYKNKCKAFIWNSTYSNHKQFYGLIVDITDDISIANAEHKYKLKKTFI